jgi:hypothetical protein
MKMYIISIPVILGVCVDADNDNDALEKADKIISDSLKHLDYEDYNKDNLEIIEIK